MLAWLPVGRVGSLFSCVSILPFGFFFSCSSCCSWCLPLFTSTRAYRALYHSLYPYLLHCHSYSPTSSLFFFSFVLFFFFLAAVLTPGELLFDCFITFINAAAATTGYQALPFVGPPRASGISSKLPRHRPIVAGEKMRILILYCP